MAFKMNGSPMQRNFGIGGSPLDKTGPIGDAWKWIKGKAGDAHQYLRKTYREEQQDKWGKSDPNKFNRDGTPRVK